MFGAVLDANVLVPSLLRGASATGWEHLEGSYG